MSNQKISKSPVFHEFSNDDSDDDNDDLPDVRFQEPTPITTTPNTNKITKAATAPPPLSASASVNKDKLSKNFSLSPLLLKSSSVKITGNYETVLNYKEKYAKYIEYTQYKKETDEAIKRGGFQFDKNAQLIAQNQDEAAIALNNEQIEILNKFKTNIDPLIPQKPKLDKLFNFELLNSLYRYPNSFNLNSFNHKFTSNDDNKGTENFLKKAFNGNIHQISEKNVFVKYFTQIAVDDADRICLMNHLFYYATSFIDDYKVLFAYETLSAMLALKEATNIKWKLSASMLLQVYKNWGLDLNQFNGKFVNLIEEIENDSSTCLQTTKQPKQAKITTNDNSKFTEQKMFTMLDLFMEKLLGLILLCLKKKPTLYNESELDFIFLLIIYTCMDENYEQLNVKLQTKLIFEEILSIYSENAWQGKKQDLCKKILNLTCKHHHRIVYINTYFELTYNKRMKEISFQIAFICVLNILLNKNNYLSTDDDDGNEIAVKEFYVEFYKIDLTQDQLSFLLSSLKENCTYVYSNSSYAMFSLIKCLDVVLIEVMNIFEREYINKFVNELKCILTTIRRNVKDKLEFQGRHQVQVILTNLISKCEYYLNEYDRKKLTLSNFVFENTNNDRLIPNEPSKSVDPTPAAVMINDNNDVSMANDDSSSLSMSISENLPYIASQPDTSTIANSSLLPSI